MNTLSKCPKCGDTSHYESLNNVYCCTRECKNFCAQQEKETISLFTGYVVLCFCDDCIFCRGKIKQFDTFRLDNIIYELYFARYDFGLGSDDYLLALYGDTLDSSIRATIEDLDWQYSLKENPKFKPLIEGHKSFKKMIVENPDFLNSIHETK